VAFPLPDFHGTYKGGPGVAYPWQRATTGWRFPLGRTVSTGLTLPVLATPCWMGCDTLEDWGRPIPRFLFTQSRRLCQGGGCDRSFNRSHQRRLGEGVFKPSGTSHGRPAPEDRPCCPRLPACHRRSATCDCSA
jgi:hypothetical protein